MPHSETRQREHGGSDAAHAPHGGPSLPGSREGLVFLYHRLCHTPGTLQALAHSIFPLTLCGGDGRCPHVMARLTEAESLGTCSKSHSWSMTELRFEPETAANPQPPRIAGAPKALRPPGRVFNPDEHP